MWDELLVYMESKARSFVLASIAVTAAAAIAVIDQTRRQVDNEWMTTLLLGLFCAAVVAGSVGGAFALRGAARKSRGALVADFLNGGENAEEYCARLSKVYDDAVYVSPFHITNTVYCQPCTIKSLSIRYLGPGP